MADSTSVIAPTGGDYTSLSAWYAAKNTAGTAGHHIAQVKADGTNIYAGTTFGSPAFTETSSNYFEIQAYNVGGTDNRFKGTFKATPDYPRIGPLVFTDHKYFRVSNIVVHATATYYNTVGTLVGIDGTFENCLFDSCGFDVQATSSGTAKSDLFVYGFRLSSVGSSSQPIATISNCVFRQISGSNTKNDKQTEVYPVYVYIGASGSTVNVYHCVFNTTSATVDSGGAAGVCINGKTVGTLRVYNCLLMNPTAATKSAKIASGNMSIGSWVASSPQPTFDCGYNATDGTGIEQGSNNQTSVTLSNEIQSTTYATFDAHLKSTSPKMKGNGSDLSGKPSIPTYDVDGDLW